MSTRLSSVTSIARIWSICRVFRVVLEVDDQPVDLGRLEAGNGDVEAFLQEELVKLRQFDSQALAVPSGILRDLVVREQESALLRLA
jgi:hypothetical protein